MLFIRPEVRQPDESIIFYELQTVDDKYNNWRQLIFMGDLNARVGNNPLLRILWMIEEDTENDNIMTLKDFSASNKLWLTHIFFRQKNIQLYMAKRYISLVDIWWAMQKIEGNVRETRVSRGYKIRSDYFLILCQNDVY